MSTTTHDGQDTVDRRPDWVGVTGLQCELRRLFAGGPVHRALNPALGRIAASLGAQYAVVHAGFAGHMLSEEWCADETRVTERVRDLVNQTMWEATSEETAKCAYWSHGGDYAVAAAVMYDKDVEQTGAAAILLRDCDRERAASVLAQFESLIGFLALLINDSVVRKQSARAWGSADRLAHTVRAAEHPVRLAYAMAAELKNRYGFETTAVGFVRRQRVKVVAVCGMDELRDANPGVERIRAAMEECLDRGKPLFSDGNQEAAAGGPPEDYRLHAQWSAAAGGNAVASFPLELLDEVVAVISVSYDPANGLRREHVLGIAESPELVQYGAMVPISQTAARSVPVHIAQAVGAICQRLVGRGRRRAVALVALLISLMAWLVFGKLDYSFAVPCAVKAANRRVVACPREGVLSELFVRPGDRVRTGQLLAVLDAHEDVLRKLELEAEITSTQARADAALAKREFGQLRVLEAEKRTLTAQLQVVERAIARAEIRAPQPGVILHGDLREQLGSQMSEGDPMFELARYDRMHVELRIPERLILDARDAQMITFASHARPDVLVPLDDLRLAPSSDIVDGKNVFLSEAVAMTTLEKLAPGMEGVVHMDAGYRPVWWVLSHRALDWFRLNFWF